MTINSQVNKISYAGDGSSVTFSIPFDFQSTAAYVYVIVRDADGVDTVQVLNADYTISSSNVVFTTAPAVNTVVLIYRSLPLLQPLDIDPDLPPPAQSLEAQLDRLTMMLQQLKQDIGRCLKQTDTDTASVVLSNSDTRANTVLGFDEDGNPECLAIPDAVIGNNAIATSMIQDGAVTTAKIQNDAVTTDKLKASTNYCTLAAETDFASGDDLVFTEFFGAGASANGITVATSGLYKIELNGLLYDPTKVSPHRINIAINGTSIDSIIYTRDLTNTNADCGFVIDTLGAGDEITCIAVSDNAETVKVESIKFAVTKIANFEE